MKQWRIWTLLALLLALPILWAHASGQELLQDTDTAFLLHAIRERHAPMSWFGGDWPLQNHFYRPLPTLTFELDNALYGSNAAGYGWTNACLCALCVWLLYWMLLELSQRPPWAFAGSALFTLWNLDLGDTLTQPILWIALGVVLVGLYRHRSGIRLYLPAGFVLAFLAVEIAAPEVTAVRSLQATMIGWLPGRTASVMTVFALASLAAYFRYERARDDAPERASAALDLPKRPRPPRPRIPGLWLTLSVITAAAAFASYEQAVMLPAVILASAVFLRLRGGRPRWATQAWYWGLLVGYLLLRHALIPSGVSGYQAQQFRHGMGVGNDLSRYVLPNFLDFRYAFDSLTYSGWMLMSVGVLWSILAAGSTVLTAFQVRRNSPVVLAGWALSTLAFLPMAWLKPFAHYHYWPLALRTIFVLGIVKIAWDLMSIAVCPPARQAPPRPSPAPGSLLHP